MKKAFKAGFIAGGILGLLTALGMDLLLGKGIGVGWTEAVANDLNRIFNTAYPPFHPVVIAGAVIVVGFIGCIGGLMGGGFASLIARAISALQRIEKKAKP